MQTAELDRALEMLTATGLVRLGKITGSYQTAYCPFHKDGNESKPSFGILRKDEYRNGRKYNVGWAHCFTCGYANDFHIFLGDLLKKKSITQSAHDWLVANVPGFQDTEGYESLIPEGLMEQMSAKFAVDYLQQLTAPRPAYITEQELASYRFVVPYMYERKLTDEIIEKFDVGYDANWVPPGRVRKVPCITFPVRDREGNTLFICRRSIQGKMYNYPEGVSKPVYGLDVLPHGCSSVIICESIINALTAWSYSYYAVALLGTGNSLQLQQLRELGVREYVICTDGDEAGRKAASKLKRALSKNALIWTIPMPDGKDLNDCTKEEFDRLYAMRE